MKRKHASYERGEKESEKENRDEEKEGIKNKQNNTKKRWEHLSIYMNYKAYNLV